MIASMRRSLALILGLCVILGEGLAQGGAACFPGQVEVQGHCCWPGQTYQPQRRACAGTPTECPPGMARSADDCVEAGRRGALQRATGPRGPAGPAGEDPIAAVIHQGGSGLRMCYERALRKTPGLLVVSGIRFTVDDGGRVRGVAIHGGKDPNLLRCLTEVVRRWRFPPPPGGAVQISYSVTADSVDTAPIQQRPLRRR